MKKTLSSISVLLLTVLCVALLSPCAYAQTVYTEGNLNYTINDGSITIVKCFGKDDTVEVPSSIAGVPVNSIASGAFSSNQYIKKVVLPDTITSVDSGAFSSDTSVIYSGIESSSKESNSSDVANNGSTQQNSTQSAVTNISGKAADNSPVSDNLNISNVDEKDSILSSENQYTIPDNINTGEATGSISAVNDNVQSPIDNNSKTNIKTIPILVLTPLLILLVFFIYIKRKSK